MSDLSRIPTSHYNLGRLSLVIPKELQPQIREFYYKWDSRTEDKFDFSFGYPISLREYPLSSGYSQHEQWISTIAHIKQKYKKKIFLEWNLNNLFTHNAYFICLKKWRGECCFFVFVQEIKCILHYTYIATSRAKETPKNDEHTNNIIKNIFNFYKKYKFGHNIKEGNIFFTYFGEIVNNKINNNEKMLLIFNNNNDSLRCSIDTNINPIGKNEENLNQWMVKNKDLNLFSSKMIKLPNLPGNAYEKITNDNDDYITCELYYNGPARSTSIPSFKIDFVITTPYNIHNILAYWKIIIQNISPLQKKNYVG